MSTHLSILSDNLEMMIAFLRGRPITPPSERKLNELRIEVENLLVNFEDRQEWVGILENSNLDGIDDLTDADDYPDSKRMLKSGVKPLCMTALFLLALHGEILNDAAGFFDQNAHGRDWYDHIFRRNNPEEFDIDDEGDWEMQV